MWFVQEEALVTYTEAVQTCLEAKKRTTDSIMQEKLGKLALDALERAEILKKESLIFMCY